jgi:hypothetical protein
VFTIWEYKGNSTLLFNGVPKVWEVERQDEMRGDQRWDEGRETAWKSQKNKAYTLEKSFHTYLCLSLIVHLSAESKLLIA